MEAVYSSETLVNCHQATWRDISEDDTFFFRFIVSVVQNEVGRSYIVNGE
jgi:hypothetical protein